MALGHSDTAPAIQFDDLGQQLIAATFEHLKSCDESALTLELNRHWPPDRLADLLDSDDDNMVKVAATCLGLVGDLSHCPALARCLHHDDSVVVAMADHALWRIWFRQGPRPAQADLCEAVWLIEQSEFQQAIQILDGIVAVAPCFAEAYNQRAIAHYLSGAYVESIADAKRVLRLNPTHYAALAGVGHCLVQLGRYRDAIETYHAVLGIHPRLAGVRQSIRRARTWDASAGRATD